MANIPLLDFADRTIRSAYGLVRLLLDKVTMNPNDGRRRATAEKILFLGTPCPLCRVTGRVWVGAFEEEIANNIRAVFPRWSREEGACERCIAAYTPPRLI